MCIYIYIYVCVCVCATSNEFPPLAPQLVASQVMICSHASVLETLLTAQTGLVLKTATYRRQKRSTQTDTKETDSRSRTVAEG